MEKARELAAVNLKVEQGDSRKTSEFVDFSSNAHSVQTKFYTVSLISIFVSLFDLDTTSAFFGFRSVDVNERIIELGFFLIALCLGLLFFLRIWEERDIFHELDEETKRGLENYEKRFQSMQTAFEGFQGAILDSGFLNGTLSRNLYHSNRLLQEAFVNVKNEILPAKDRGNTDRAEDEFRMALTKARVVFETDFEELKVDISQKSEILTQLISSWQMQLQHFLSISGNMKERKRLASKQRFRLILFDFFAPFITVLLVFCAFIFPEQSLFVLELIVGTE